LVARATSRARRASKRAWRAMLRFEAWRRARPVTFRPKTNE
jgi:hypothetical protein